MAVRVLADRSRRARARCACGCPCIGAGGVRRSVSWRSPPVRLRMPSAMSMRATANSIASPTGGGMTTSKAMIATPTTTTVTEWPSPHSAPIRVSVREAAAAVEDRGHRDDVVGVGRVAHAEQEAESCEREELGHRVVSVLIGYCNALQLRRLTIHYVRWTSAHHGRRSARCCAAAACAGRPSARRSSTSWPRRTATSPARSSSNVAAPEMRGRPRRPCTARSIVLEGLGLVRHGHGADGREEFHVLPASRHGHLHCSAVRADLGGRRATRRGRRRARFAPATASRSTSATSRSSASAGSCAASARA